jgi:hypothetical protein
MVEERADAFTKRSIKITAKLADGNCQGADHFSLP